jgi:hypothetical protein
VKLRGAGDYASHSDRKGAVREHQFYPSRKRSIRGRRIAVGTTLGLVGAWVGSGFNLISLPDRANDSPFRLKIDATRESLEFKSIGSAVPNRGSKQDDLSVSLVNYTQQVSNAVTNELLHVESGQWLNVPETIVPSAPASVVRQATILHGDSLLAQGVSLVIPGPPIIDAVDTTPTGLGVTPAYLGPFANPSLPPGFKAPYIGNPNLALQEVIKGQTITETVVLTISTNPIGGILNIPFLVENANPTRLDATFWIETVQQQNGSGSFMQLQYTQKVILNFLGIDWPHISVATLIKQ